MNIVRSVRVRRGGDSIGRSKGAKHPSITGAVAIGRPGESEGKRWLLLEPIPGGEWVLGWGEVGDELRVSPVPVLSRLTGEEIWLSRGPLCISFLERYFLLKNVPV